MVDHFAHVTHSLLLIACGSSSHVFFPKWEVYWFTDENTNSTSHGTNVCWLTSMPWNTEDQRRNVHSFLKVLNRAMCKQHYFIFICVKANSRVFLIWNVVYLRVLLLALLFTLLIFNLLLSNYVFLMLHWWHSAVFVYQVFKSCHNTLSKYYTTKLRLLKCHIAVSYVVWTDLSLKIKSHPFILLLSWRWERQEDMAASMLNEWRKCFGFC